MSRGLFFHCNAKCDAMEEGGNQQHSKLLALLLDGKSKTIQGFWLHDWLRYIQTLLRVAHKMKAGNVATSWGEGKGICRRGG